MRWSLLWVVLLSACLPFPTTPIIDDDDDDDSVGDDDDDSEPEHIELDDVTRVEWGELSTVFHEDHVGHAIFADTTPNRSLLHIYDSSRSDNADGIAHAFGTTSEGLGVGVQQLDLGIARPRDSELVDVDDDGALDVMILDAGHWNETDNVPLVGGAILTVPAEGAAGGSAIRSPLLRNPSGFAFGDINGDGHLDAVASAAWEFGHVEILHGDGSGSFVHATDFAVEGGVIDVELADMDNDGRLDLLALTAAEEAGVAQHDLLFFAGDGAGSFGAEVRTVFVNLWPWSVKTGDFDEDGVLDVSVTPALGGPWVHYGVGDGNFEGGQQLDTAITFQRVLDMDGDGHLDIVGRPPGAVGAVMVFGDGTGGWYGVQEDDLGLLGIALVDWADFNRDGKIDVGGGGFTAEGDNIFILPQQ